MLRQLWPHGDSKVPGLIAGIVSAQFRVYGKWGITNDTIVAQAFANFSHECGGGIEMVENRNYSAERAAEVWPLHASDDDEKRRRHFSSASDCYAKCGSFPGDPDFHRKLLNLVYGTRMGNRPGTNDGYDLVGRGLSQCTGHDGYVKLGQAMGLDLISNPDLISAPANALEAGIADFVLCGCLPYAKQDNLVGSASCLNLGHYTGNTASIQGFSERAQWLNKWKAALAGSPQIVVTGKPAPSPVPAPQPAPAKKSKKNVAAGGAIITGGAAAQQAHAAGFSPLIVAAIVVGTIVVAGVVWYVLHKKAANQ